MLIDEYEEWYFDLNQADWINIGSESTLSHYQLLQELLNLLQYGINTHLE